MGPDIVEIGIDSITDSTDFEKMASEIMRDEGYKNIKPLGGVTDKGIDAIQDRYEINESRTVTVFQYTLQEYLPGKIRDTIEKLNKTKVKYNELVIVTPNAISTERQDQIKRDGRSIYGITLNIYEKKALVNRLSNFDNGIFYRHFPDIEKQIKSLISKKPLLSSNDATLLESAMLKSSLVFNIGRDSPRVRDSVFDTLTFSIITGINKEDISAAELIPKFRESTGLQIPLSQLEASLRRLSSKGLIKRQAEFITITKFAKQYEATNTIRVNDATKSLISDILQQLISVSGGILRPPEMEIISRNTKEVLTKLFRLFGIEISEKIFKDTVSQSNYIQLSDDLVNTTKKDLSPELGNLLISCISQIIKHPTKDQANTLSYWAMSYIGVQIMNLDPNLRQLHAVRFSKKIFVLDTDFILDCVVRECPLSRVYLELVNTLIRYGCKLIIPKSCISECITHAKISYRTYNHFGSKLLSIMDIFIDEVVWNIFVKGYYFGRINSEISPTTTFSDYLKNYYEPLSAESFFLDVIRETFPEGVEITELSSLMPEGIPEERIQLMSKELLSLQSSSLKYRYRSPESAEDLAKIDAQLFMCALYKNQSSSEIANEEILGGCCYLVTSSSKYLRAAKRIGLRDVVTSRPQTLVALLDVIGGIKIDPQDFVLLFENPLLINAVQQTWEDVETLIESGIELRDKTLPRLRWDLDQVLHSKISALTEAENKAKSTMTDEDITNTDTEFTELVKTASERGYRNIPEIEIFLRALQSKEMKVEETEQAYNDLLRKYTQLESEISHFGKRKQNYLRRVTIQKEKK